MSDWSQHKVAKLCPPRAPSLACPGGFPRAARAPIGVAFSNVPGREKKEVPGVHARHLADRKVPQDRRSH